MQNTINIEQLSTTAIILLFIGVLWMLLTTVLFFKIWQMTNDISEIRSLMEDNARKDKEV